MKAKKKAPKQSEPKTQTSILRIPRQEGITTMMHKYHTHDKDERIKKLVQTTILSRYITQGMSINGETKDLEWVSKYLGMELKDILARVTSTTESLLGITEGSTEQGNKGLQVMGRALISQAFFMALNDRGLIQKQALDLMASQGAQYQPYMSSTVNQALKNLLDSQKPFTDLLKVFQVPTTNILVQNNGSQNGQPSVPNKSVSIQDAIQLINESNEGLGLLERPEARLALQEQYGTEQFPEVVATRQQGTIQKEVDIYRPKKIRKHEDRVEGLGEIEA